MLSHQLFRKRTFFILLLLFPYKLCFAFDHNHKLFTEILNKYTDSKKNFVYYKKLKKNQTVLNRYLTSLRSVSLKSYNKWNNNEKKTFLINAYNAFTIKVIVHHYPVESIKDIGSIFTNTWKKEFSFLNLLNGTIKTLDQIEHDTLRKNFKDYRIHAAVNCASISCPVLRQQAYTAKQLDFELDEQMTKWLSDPSKNQFILNKNLMILSKIFSWYEDDFFKQDNLLNIINKYGPKAAKLLVRRDYKIEYMDYNWKLNEIN